MITFLLTSSLSMKVDMSERLLKFSLMYILSSLVFALFIYQRILVKKGGATGICLLNEADPRLSEIVLLVA
ncbi:hypothetical protein D3C87_1232130 [compost metagenome]